MNMNFFQEIWDNIDSLQKTSSILQWISWGLILLGLVLQVTKHYVDKRDKQLTKKISDERILGLGKHENVYLQPIRTASATVEVIINSNDSINTTYMDIGGYLTFVKDQKPLLEMTSTTCSARQLGESKVLYKGVFNMDVTSEITKENILFLKKSEFVQIGFGPMPVKQKVLTGKAIVTINSLIRIEMEIPQQLMSGTYIAIPNIQKYFSDFKE